MELKVGDKDRIHEQPTSATEHDCDKEFDLVGNVRRKAGTRRPTTGSAASAPTAIRRTPNRQIAAVRH